MSVVLQILLDLAYNLEYNMYNFDCYCPWHIIYTTKHAKLPVVTNKVRGHHKGSRTVLAELLLLFVADCLQRLSYDCRKGPLDVLCTVRHVSGQTW